MENKYSQAFKDALFELLVNPELRNNVKESSYALNSFSGLSDSEKTKLIELVKEESINAIGMKLEKREDAGWANIGG